MPPAVTDRTARAAFARCVPGASPPTTVVEVHSPVAVDLEDGSGGFAIRGVGTGIETYVVPHGSAGAVLTGTGTGPVSVVVRTGSDARTYAFTARRGATGHLRLSESGAPTAVTFAGRRIPGGAGVRLRMTGLPSALKAGRTTKATLRVTDVFGSAAQGVTVSGRGTGVRITGVTDRRGIVRIVLRPTSRGSVTLAATAPASAGVRVRIPSR